MATQVQLRRGTATENDAFTGAQGELTFDTTNKRVRIHDGATAGGFELKTENSSGDTLFADNEKAIFGAGSDLQIYHNSSNGRSYITESGSGAFVIQGENLILEETGGNNYIQATAGGAVQVYHNGSEKLATTSTGVDITGTLTSDGLTVAQSNPVITITDTDGSTTTTLKTLGSNTELSNTTGGNLRFRTSVSELERMRISPDGDISFYEDTGTTAKFFWDASAESLGIGGASPAGTAFAVTNAGAEGLEIRPTGGLLGGTSITAYNRSGSAYIPQTYNASQHIFVNSGSSNEKMRIDSSGNVGIGTSSPSSTLAVETGSIASLSSYAGHIVVGPSSRTSSSGDYSGGILFDQANGVQASGKKGASITGFQDGSDVNSMGITFNVHGTDGSANRFEAMRIDSSGNLLVGKTSASSSTVGFQAAGVNGAAVNRDGGVALITGRLTSDGEIQRFTKDGTTVGSIGTDTTYGEFFISGAGNRGGIGFYDIGFSGIQPVNSDGSVSDGDTNLGYTSSRFKDLYLSGGVYLGGTGAANKLDDYEEGTWTPVLACIGQSGSFTHTTQAGHYRKIGQLVFVTGRADWTAKPSAGANFQVTGLPFAYSGNSYANDLGISVGYSVGIPNTDGLYGKLVTTGGGSRTAVGFYSNGSTTVNVTTGNDISTSGQIRFSLTYFTA